MGALAKFSVVGVLGFVVQLVTVGFLSSRLHWPWLPATVVGVEAAIVHNYFWHVRWTWKDRVAGFAQFASFHCLNGVTSLLGNVVLVALLIDRLHLSILVANVIAVLALSLVNFLAADRWV